jgi:hypothetical protein
LAYIFRKYCKGKAGTKDTLMNMKEWIRFLQDMQLMDSDFTKREGRLVSRLHV